MRKFIFFVGCRVFTVCSNVGFRTNIISKCLNFGYKDNMLKVLKNKLLGNNTDKKIITNFSSNC